MEIHNNDINHQVLGTAHVYKVKRKRILKDGTVKQYETTVNYKPKTDRAIIDDELKQKIITDYKFGLPKTKIAKKYNLTPYRVSNIVDN